MKAPALFARLGLDGPTALSSKRVVPGNNRSPKPRVRETSAVKLMQLFHQLLASGRNLSAMTGHALNTLSHRIWMMRTFYDPAGRARGVWSPKVCWLIVSATGKTRSRMWAHGNLHHCENHEKNELEISSARNVLNLICQDKNALPFSK